MYDCCIIPLEYHDKRRVLLLSYHTHTHMIYRSSVIYPNLTGLSSLLSLNKVALLAASLLPSIIPCCDLFLFVWARQRRPARTTPPLRPMSRPPAQQYICIYVYIAERKEVLNITPLGHDPPPYTTLYFMISQC